MVCTWPVRASPFLEMSRASAAGASRIAGWNAVQAAEVTEGKGKESEQGESGRCTVWLHGGSPISETGQQDVDRRRSGDAHAFGGRVGAGRHAEERLCAFGDGLQIRRHVSTRQRHQARQQLEGK